MSKNNNRDWFNENKTRFKSVESQVKLFQAEVFESVCPRLIIWIRSSCSEFTETYDLAMTSHRIKPILGARIEESNLQIAGGYYVHIQTQ